MSEDNLKKPRLTDISRAVSHALRHEPWIYELELDDGGWTTVAGLLAALREKGGGWKTVTEADFAAIIAQSEKTRFEMTGDRIRALYGHSIPQRLEYAPAEPPATLWHGTSQLAAEVILREGLRPMGRQYVHLSADIETARQVGLRKASDPVILVVDAKAAASKGHRFHRGNATIWLADAVPAEFVAC